MAEQLGTRPVIGKKDQTVTEPTRIAAGLGGLATDNGSSIVMGFGMGED